MGVFSKVCSGKGIHKFFFFSFCIVFLGLTIFSLHHLSLAETKQLWIEGNESEPQVEINLPNFAPVIEKLGQSVVNISIKGMERSDVLAGIPRGARPPFGGDSPSPFDFFFQIPPKGQTRRINSLGSGFVIHPDGYIVTNNHVIDKANEITVSFRDEKKTYKARVIGSDRKTDLALLKVEVGKPLTSVIFGDSDKVKPGEWVIAIGNPFKLGHTATVGIVSAKSRKWEDGNPYDDFIQTDASINPGNSGGPLFNIRGEVIGINTAIFSPGQMGGAGFNIGIGFATPINIVKEIISQLTEKGKVVRGWLGVKIQPINEDKAQALSLSSDEGSLVAEVLPGSPAAKGGVLRGDVILEYDGSRIAENDILPRLVARTPIGKEIQLKINRKGVSKSLTIRIEELKDSDAEESTVDEPEEPKLGMSFQDLTPEIARSLGLEITEGVVVTNVVPDSEAEQQGVRRGDVIVEIFSQSVSSSSDLKRLMKEAKKGKPLLILLNRNNETFYVTLKLD